MMLRSVPRLLRRISWSDTHSVTKTHVHYAVGKLLSFQEPVFFRSCFCRYLSIDSRHVTPVFLRAENFRERTAAVTQHGRYTYEDLLHYSAALANEFNEVASSWKNEPDYTKDSRFPLAGERIAFLCENDLSYVVTQWAVWMCGAVAVPLCKSHPISELEYFADDSGAKLLVCCESYRDILEPVSQNHNISLKMITLDDFSGDYDDDCHHLETDKGRRLRHSLEALLVDDTYRYTKAQIIYTSGTTGRPKGVVHTFGNLDAQMQAMISAWGWTSSDVILHVLPLHHVHGIVNVLMTPLYCGAMFFMLPNFDPKEVWKALLRDDLSINMFMAVPTIYAKLIEEYDKQRHADNKYIPDNLPSVLTEKFRLMVSGSAALPQPVMKKWEDITGHTLLERYGMTEVGMALTNPLHGKRVPGTVGLPFPGVSVQIVEHDKQGDGYRILASGDSQNIVASPGLENHSGELLIKGDNVFSEYWNRPDATADAFMKDGWFKTGDTAMYIDGVIKIVGRTSVDVIKSGAYKISALDIERHLLEHFGIKDVAVIGLPDETWGQMITAVLVMKPGETVTLPDLQAWCKDKMAPYHIPRNLKILDNMPRNAMGKVNKKELAKSLFPEHFKES
ncbi:malonate--CoA ligase ACSF3, mitochondrial-like [Mercenaria mercenaria]|uniref:malonate--CoA ligase ACSF3, mitochondrial-like n=1 Tax=Mercenaria mercenaria TaxID=6596 RepID=UPI00234EF6A8|nr:malonate--CoA ligase ACSF3, mitochondrial-like [Mercenaria mercenaria]XP_053401631.1 malonate--CoA ligase ACSF3, mitochondrial-like [Mercenaria mercenaria]XP_053401632.1 malonate--CoA ligase ACSF3, mitochondrial-like [Mercenaria mercenaria]